MCKMLARSGGEPGVMNVFADTHSSEVLFSGSWAQCKAYILENGYGKRATVAEKQQPVAKNVLTKDDAVKIWGLIKELDTQRKGSKAYKAAYKSLGDIFSPN